MMVRMPRILYWVLTQARVLPARWAHPEHVSRWCLRATVLLTMPAGPPQLLVALLLHLPQLPQAIAQVQIHFAQEPPTHSRQPQALRPRPGLLTDVFSLNQTPRGIICKLPTQEISLSALQEQEDMMWILFAGDLLPRPPRRAPHS